jgi:hypothetical protein
MKKQRIIRETKHIRVLGIWDGWNPFGGTQPSNTLGLGSLLLWSSKCIAKLIMQSARMPGIKKASAETDASKCAQPGGLWQGLTGRAAVRAILAAAVVTPETSASAAVMAASAAAVIVVEMTLFAALATLVRIRTALILVLAFWAGTKLWPAVAVAIVATITATTASTARILALAATVATAIASFVTTTVAGTFVLARSRCGCLSLLGGVASEDFFQPPEDARFFGFGYGSGGLRLKRAGLAALFVGLAFAFTELLAAFARLLAPRFTRTEVVARFLRLVDAG